MTLSGSVEKVDQVMAHVGLFGKSSAKYYCRMSTLVDSGVVASKLAESVYQADAVEIESLEKKQIIQD
jgi:hypothetical protein